MIGEAFPNENGGNSSDLAVSKGYSGVRFSTPLLKYDLWRCCQSSNSGSITGYRASPRPDRPVLANPIHLDVKPAICATWSQRSLVLWFA